MKKIYLLLASLFLLFFTGCDAILDSAYPDYAPKDEFINSNYDYSFEVDGLPSGLYANLDEYTEYYPIVHANETDPALTIDTVEFKVLDHDYNNAGYDNNYGFIDTSMYDDFYSIYNSPNNYSNYKDLYSFYAYDYNEWDNYTLYDYFHLDLTVLDQKINEPWWDSFDMKLEIKVIFSDGYHSVQTYDIDIY